MATDKKGRKLPKGIRQRYDGYEGRFMHEGQEYLVHGATITETQKLMEDLRYKVRHGIIASSHKVINIASAFLGFDFLVVLKPLIKPL